MFSNYKNKKVTVIGLARSGIAACHLLKNLEAEVFATDSADSRATKDLAQELRKRGISVETGRHSLDFIRGKDLVVVSPGVENSSPALLWADEFKIPIISEIELAWSVCPATVIAITGTNGKTTVTTLIAQVLNGCGKKALALGNIGQPFSACALNLNKDDFVSLEVSSFQLERINKFKPRVSVILNFTSDHLNRYKDMTEYLAAKKRIFRNQDKGDYLVLNYDDPVLRDLAKETPAAVVFFDSNLPASPARSFIAERAGRQPSNSNLNLNPNHLAVMAVAGIFGIPREIYLKVFADFKGVEHRLEKAGSINGVDFINDSKATNVDSAIWALTNIRQPIILIAGGRDKNSDYTVIKDLLKQKVKLLVLIGEAKEKMSKAFSGLLPILEAASLEEAVDQGLSRARTGDCVLLSPMCASFDMFNNYEHRGTVFKEIVNKLK